MKMNNILCTIERYRLPSPSYLDAAMSISWWVSDITYYTPLEEMLEFV